MAAKQVFYLSGVPRSGSTVLASLLNQNPDFYVTQTSPVLDAMQTISSAWGRLSANVLDQEPAQLKNILNGIHSSAYNHTPASYIVDKHRAWPANINYIQAVTDARPKIICTTRNISEIIASFIILIDKTDGVSYIDQELLSTGKPINTATRARLLWEKYINVPWSSLRKGWEQHPDCLKFVDYADIINNPELTLSDIYKFLGVPNYTGHTTTKLQPMRENDEAWGLPGLHNIRPTLKKTSPPASDILGKELAEYYNSLSLEFWK